jgi:hypothetical protein
MAKNYALGGDVQDDEQDDKPAVDLDVDSGGDDTGGDTGGSPHDDALNTVSDVLSFGRQKYGIGQQVAGNMPSAPAGPGGEGQRTPAQQPFQPASGGVPFGKRNSYAEGGAVEDPRDDQQGAYNPTGDDPVGAVLSGALDSAGSATSAPMSPMEAGQGDAEMGAIQSAGGALGGNQDQPQQDRPSDDNPLSPSSLRTALDPRTFHQNMGNIISYLRGKDAVPPQAAAQAEQMVDPHGEQDHGLRKLLAIDAVNKQYGPQAAFGLLQHYRQKYDAYKAFAAAANAGTQGKPRDPAAAAMAMQQAYDHVPDGQNLVVKPSENGFTATVSDGRGGKPQTVSLTPQQFGQLVQGPDGQFDNVIERGLPNVLTKFMQRNGLTADQVQPDTSTSAPPGSEAGGGGRTGLAGEATTDLGYDKQLVARSRALFPAISQNAQRLAWLNAQEQQGTENRLSEKKLDNTILAVAGRGQNQLAVQGLKNQGNEKVADVRAGSYDKRTDVQRDVGAGRNEAYDRRSQVLAENAKLRAASTSNDVRMRNASNIVGRAISQGQMYDSKGNLDPTVQNAAKLLNVNLQALSQQSQGQPAPQAQQGQEQPAPTSNAPLSAQDQQALNWANSNPTDPRAAAIKARLKVK